MGIPISLLLQKGPPPNAHPQLSTGSKIFLLSRFFSLSCLKRTLFTNVLNQRRNLFSLSRNSVVKKLWDALKRSSQLIFCYGTVDNMATT